MDKHAAFGAGLESAMEKVAKADWMGKAMNIGMRAGGAMGGGLTGAAIGAGGGALTAKPGERGKGARRGALAGGAAGALGGGWAIGSGKGGKYLKEMPGKVMKEIDKGKDVKIDPLEIAEKLKKIDPGYARRGNLATYGAGGLAGGLAGLSARKGKDAKEAPAAKK
jgi:hypothetical protein